MQKKYIFALYHLSTPTDSGTWCNCDNSTYFKAYNQTSLTINTSVNAADSLTGIQMLLVFKDVDCVVQLFGNGNAYSYNYAPEGLECSIITFGIGRNGHLFASRTDITIGNNQTIAANKLTAITTSDFKTKLKSLN